MRYVIAAPSYTQKSAGIRVLYELQKWLVRYGKDAMVLNFKSPYQVEADDIVVYPEIVSGNPLGARRVVRYILNHPGRIGGDKEYDRNEILIAYDGELGQYSHGVVLATPCIEEFFSNRGYERNIDCLFVGKGTNTGHSAARGCIEITYQWPANRRELAELLNRTRYFYSYDQRTALRSEAAWCGCQVRDIIGDEVIEGQSGPFDMELFKRQLEQFIQMTWYPEIDLNEEASRSIDIGLSARCRAGASGASSRTASAALRTPDAAMSTSSHTVPSATVVVPVTNGWEATFRSLLALSERSSGVRREVIVVDNGCTDDTRLALPQLENVRVIRNESDEGFARACNQAAAQAQGDVLVFLDRDAEVSPGWLERLMNHFTDPLVASAGPGERLSGAFLAVRAADYREANGLDEKDPAAAEGLLGGFLRRGRRVVLAEDVPMQVPPPAPPPEPVPPASHPPVSIVVPVRDAGATLPECLQAIEGNLRPGDEVVIADGGSEDDTLRCAFEFAARHHRIVKVVDHVGGVAGALRQGLGVASREMTLIVSPRVVMPSGFVDGTHALLSGQPTAGALAVEVPRMGICVLGRLDDLRAIATSNVNALFKQDGVDLGRALQQIGKQLAYVPAPVGRAA